VHLSLSTCWFLAALGAHLAAGCDPVFSVRGHVRTQADASAKPVDGATVTLQCPAVTTTIATTDARGEFEYMSGGLMNPACNLIISKAGLATRTISVGETCSSTFMGGCHEVVVDAELAASSDVAPVDAP
jgi:hypothetical protein